MKELTHEPDLRFNELYDSIIGETGAFENYNKFIESISRCRTKNGLRYEYLSNGNYTALYAFKVMKDIDKELLETFISYAYSLNIRTCSTFLLLEERLRHMLEPGKVVQFRLDSLTEYFTALNPSSKVSKLDCSHLNDTRLNYYFYILVSEMLESGVIEPFTKASSKHLIYDTTDLHLDDLTIASNLISAKQFGVGKAENGIFLNLVGENPAKFGFDPELFDNHPELFGEHAYTTMPRVISYYEPEPVKTIISPIPERKGKVKEQYGASGTDFLTISDFMPGTSGTRYPGCRHTDLSYATRFLFMSRPAAKAYWEEHTGKTNRENHFMFSPEEGYYKGVNKGWIDAAVKLAIQFHEFGEEFDLARVIRLIRATQNSALQYNEHLSFSSIYYEEDISKRYQDAILKAYGTDLSKIFDSFGKSEFC